jgi:hypothetical protein
MEKTSPEIARISNIRPRKHPWAGTATFAVLLLILALGALAWFHRDTLLRYAAEQWVVSDDIHPADAIVVLGGGVNTRPFTAAEDYLNGLAHRILVTDARRSRVETLDILPSHAEINRRVLIKLGVPETDVETICNAISTTRLGHSQPRPQRNCADGSVLLASRTLDADASACGHWSFASDPDARLPRGQLFDLVEIRCRADRISKRDNEVCLLPI